MSFKSQSHKFLCIGLAFAAVAIVAQPARAQFPELDIIISDTTATAGDSTAWISVFVRNYQDTLSAFAMLIMLDRPDIMEFRTDLVDTIIDTAYYECTWWDDNVCLDSQAISPKIDTFYVNLGVDTVGCLTNYWSVVNASSWNPGRHDIRVIGIADEVGLPYTPGLKPRTTPGLLFRMSVRLYDSLPDDQDSLVTLYMSEDLSQTTFSDQYGNAIGTITEYNICDTTYCETWDYSGDSCLTTLLDTLPPAYDTMFVDTFFRWHFCREWGLDHQGQDSCLHWDTYSDPSQIPPPDDTTTADFKDLDSLAWTVWNYETVSFDHGELRVVTVSCTCGDCDNNDNVNVGDAVFLINYIFKNGPEPEYPQCSDVNFDDHINVGDAVYLISYIFKNGPEPYCGF